MFAVSSSLSTPPSLSALRIPIFQRDPSYLHSHISQVPLENGLLKPLRCKEGNCRHGQRHHCNGLDMLSQSCPSAAPQTGTTLSLAPMTRRYVSGMLRLVLQSATH